jgi:hypothetical protein
MRLSARAIAVITVVMLAAVCAGVTAAAVRPGYYASRVGVQHKREAYLDLQVLRGGRRADWNATVFGPCSVSEYGIGISFGTNVQPPERPLQIRNGRFARSRHGVSSTGTHWAYTLLGHPSGHGFAGTVRYTQAFQNGSTHVHCDSGIIAWNAKPTKGSLA